MVTANGSAVNSQSSALNPLAATATATVPGYPATGSETWTASFANAGQGTVTLSSVSFSTGGEGGVGFGNAYFNYTGGFNGNGGFGVNNGFYYTFVADASGSLSVTTEGPTQSGLPTEGSLDGVWLATGWVPTTYFPADDVAIFATDRTDTKQFGVVAGQAYTLGIFDAAACWGAAPCSLQHSANFTFSIPSTSSAATPTSSVTCGVGIAPGGIVSLDSTASIIAPGEWVSIYGTNLASGTAAWEGDFPTSLGGTSVTIDGKSAYLEFVSPTQINLQAPDDNATGSVPAVVSTAFGTATASVTLAQFAPSLLLLDGEHVCGIILRSDGSGAYGGGAYDILGPTGRSLGYPTVAAKAGDTVELFAVGLGPTSPTVAPGGAFTGAAATTDPVNVLISGTSISPAFAGLSSAGLYQINLTIPAGLETGDVPVLAKVGGAQTQASVVIPLQ